MWDWLFYARTSEAGKGKLRLLKENQVLCANFPHQPGYRISWEILQQLMAADQAVTECVGRIVNGLLPKILAGYEPRHGIDVDIFLVVDVQPQPVFWIEIFPREHPGQLVTEFGSTINFPQVPLVVRQEEGVVDFLGALMVGELAEVCRSQEEVSRLVCNLENGCWPVRSDNALRLFVNTAAFSLVELFGRGSKALVAAGFSRDWSGGLL